MKNIVLNSICAAAACTLTACTIANRSQMTIYDIETVKVYEAPAELKPGHNAWPEPFVDADGGVGVIFQQLTGDLTMQPSYDFDKFQAKIICMRAEKNSSKFVKIWEKDNAKAYSFFIPATTPSADGKLIAMCRATTTDEYKDYPEKSVMILESADYGKTTKIRSNISAEGIILYPNDIKYIGKRLYVATYDGKGAAHLFYSDDDGYTWSKPLEIVKAHDNMSFHEPTFCELSNGNLVVFLRTHRMDIPKHNGINYHKVIINKNADGALEIAKGDDKLSNSYYFDESGKAVASPVYDTGFGFRGRPNVQKSDDNTIIFVAPGHFVAFSQDDCKTWQSGQWDFNIEKVNITDRFGTKPYNWNAETVIIPLGNSKWYYSYFIGSDFPFPAPCDTYIGGTFFKIGKADK